MSISVRTVASTILAVNVYLDSDILADLLPFTKEEKEKVKAYLLSLVTHPDRFGSSRVIFELEENEEGAFLAEKLELIARVMSGRISEIFQSQRAILPVDAKAILCYMAPGDGSIRLGHDHVNDTIVDHVIYRLKNLKDDNTLRLSGLFTGTVYFQELREVVLSIVHVWDNFHFVFSRGLKTN